MPSAEKRILIFHKPKAVVVTRTDELGRKTIYDVLPGWVSKEGWVPVGRLDRDSRGLLLLVRDSSLVERLGAPSHYQKTYEVWIRGRITEKQLRETREGVTTPIGMLRFVEASVIRTIGPRSEVRVILDEGKNRHIRRVFGALRDSIHGTPLKVLDLKRTGFGPLHLDVASGDWRFLTSEEMNELGIDGRSYNLSSPEES